MQLEEGDIIKIGKTKVKFKEIVRNKITNSSTRNPTMIVTDRE